MKIQNILTKSSPLHALALALPLVPALVRYHVHVVIHVVDLSSNMHIILRLRVYGGLNAMHLINMLNDSALDNQFCPLRVNG